ncbi:methyl-accepting chemotaxis protein [Derxia gummosa]|uniref:Methyl-accepting chemotaxis protein n=1 Tax=Derxia gummosa DSM 723 TaxID=1121388 RepID=A0A8B6X6A8_9BURK|nr:methyl-accepting chemotaxis protein [Derxia gummosa]
MGWLNQFKLSRRLALGFGLVLALCMAIVAVAWVQIAAIGAAATNLGGNTVPSLTLMANMRDGLSTARRAELRFALADDQTVRASTDEQRAKAWKTFDENYEKYGRTAISDDKDRELWQSVGKLAADYRRLSTSLRDELVAADADPARAEALRNQVNSGPVLKAVNEALQAIETDWEYNLKLADEAVAQAKRADAMARTAMVVAAALALLIGIGATLAITRSIVVPLREAVDAANRVADGDLTVRLHASGSDELADLARAQQTMIQNLSTLIGRLKQASLQIETGAGEVAAGSIDLSSRTEEQAASLEQSSASLEELTGTVKQNAEHAVQVTQLADDASNVAARGGAAVREVVSVMQEIEASSRQVEAIVGVIDGISFQTNILALNAAVEAARAGEQGRGFAVVAAEVRTLAQRSAQAAKEIKDLIGTAADKVNQGGQRVTVAGQTIDDVVSRVEKVGGLVREIGAATREQTAGIEQVSQAVSQLDAVTQQNAALVEQSTAAADSLKSQAKELAAAVAQFRVA